MVNMIRAIETYILSEDGGYSPYPNIVVSFLCIVLLISVFTIYEKRDKKFIYISGSIASILSGAVSRDMYYKLTKICQSQATVDKWAGFQVLYYLLLMLTLLLYTLYIVDVFGNAPKHFKTIILSIHMIWSIALISAVTIKAGEFPYLGQNVIRFAPSGADIYTFCLIYYLLAFKMVFGYSEKKLSLRIRIHTYTIFAIFTVISLFNWITETDTFACTALFIPLVFFLTVFKRNTFDGITGTMDGRAFDNRIDSAIKMGRSFSVACIEIADLDILINRKDFINDIYSFCHSIGYHGMIYRLNDNTLAIVGIDADKRDVEKKLRPLLNKYEKTFRSVILPWMDIIKDADDFRFVIRQELGQADDNSLAEIIPNEQYRKLQESRFVSRKILHEINDKKNMDDKHVQVFCQPIYSVKTGKVISAESLMRLYVPDYGYLFPQTFIPIAEEENCIHTLSLIIFNKVCKYLSEAPAVEMMTVNFSVVELSKREFVTDIMQAVDRYHVDPKRIGVEITESMMETDSDNTRQVITELRDLGFMILIDDFGTGYSNLSRIFDLPVTVVKFDRSLLLSSEKKSGKETITGLVNIFNRMGIQTLCEGVEDETEESFCKKTAFDYLQGYKYSRPIPIENLAKIKDRIENGEQKTEEDR